MHLHYLELCILTCGICAGTLTISLSKGLVCTLYTYPSFSGSTMMVPNHSSDSSSDLVTHWPAAYDALALPTIEALAGLSVSKGGPYGSFNKESGILLALSGL